MKRSALVLFCWMLSAAFFCGCSFSQENPQKVVQQLQMPDGFSAHIFAENVPNARQLALGDNGTVYAITDTNGDYKADNVYTIAEELRLPSGIAFNKGSLYVGAVSKILRFDEIGQRLENPPEPVVVTDTYPTDGHHGWKFIDFGPDGKLYVPVGAPCNICDPDNEIYASITRINPDGTEREIVAHGVRNSVGFDWHPKTADLWFTDNGRDWLGDNRPPCELNHLSKVGQHFGYPFKHGNDIWDPKFGEQGKKMEQPFRAPAQELGPHVAPLGMIFYTGKMLPNEYKNQILIAEHGSWNRSEKIGYRITKVSLQDGEVISYRPFIHGWLQDNEAVLGRPVDLLELEDGSILISDDLSGTIYRITYNK
ncbi:Glucose/arabinose dehydrogenase, beta-propeller fold [Fodinibius salinus]|uniref:Glucose/arabinose dehydrogenase, beta-propeller fold n=1 Tax=Fodinibius salinus TaxID=860790 RepID=A0A5D3YMW3_9BACT|nr:PQQ-dependent sugar dehydrogenase [Fodinibius salinus]TYP94041.1 Glucose/arabinose dehydrogenase, beta-propeller fold [Fodinibius salinus]